MTKLPKGLEKLIEMKAKAYRDEAFRVNPNGYSVAPGLNEPDTDYEIGGTDIALEVLKHAEKLEATLKKIDRLYAFAGTPPKMDDVWARYLANQAGQLAFAALSDWRAFVGDWESKIDIARQVMATHSETLKKLADEGDE